MYDQRKRENVENNITLNIFFLDHTQHTDIRPKSTGNITVKITE